MKIQRVQKRDPNLQQYPLQPIQEVLYGHVGYQLKAYVNTSGAIGAIWKISLVHEIQILKGSKFAVLKSVEKSLI